MGKHTRRIKKERKWTKVVLSLLLLTFSAILFAGAYLLGTDGWREFDPASVKKNISVSLTILDGNGEEYAVLSNGELRRYAPLSSIPKHTKNAFVAIEDARFYSHNGIDAVRIGGALLEDIKNGRQHHFPAAYQKHNAYFGSDRRQKTGGNYDGL